MLEKLNSNVSFRKSSSQLKIRLKIKCKTCEDLLELFSATPANLLTGQQASRYRAECKHESRPPLKLTHHFRSCFVITGGGSAPQGLLPHALKQKKKKKKMRACVRVVLTLYWWQMLHLCLLFINSSGCFFLLSHRLSLRLLILVLHVYCFNKKRDKSWHFPDSVHIQYISDNLEIFRYCYSSNSHQNHLDR